MPKSISNTSDTPPKTKGFKTGNLHHKYKHGLDTLDVDAKRTKLVAVLLHIEDMLFLVGSLNGKHHTRGNRPAGYEKIVTIEQAQNYILELEEKNNPL